MLRDVWLIAFVRRVPPSFSRLHSKARVQICGSRAPAESLISHLFFHPKVNPSTASSARPTQLGLMSPASSPPQQGGHGGSIARLKTDLLHMLRLPCTKLSLCVRTNRVFARWRRARLRRKQGHTSSNQLPLQQYRFGSPTVAREQVQGVKKRSHPSHATAGMLTGGTCTTCMI